METFATLIFQFTSV